MSIHIVTDSTADLPPALAEQHGITVVPLSVLFGDNQFRDGIDISSETFFQRLTHDPKLPTTSQPSPAEFRAVYERMRVEGATEIISIHVSSKLSQTINAARQGATDLAGVRVVHIDSEQVTLALGMGVVAAAQAVERGLTLDAVCGLAASHFQRTHTFFLLDTLEFLHRGGRIGKASALLGSLLRIKPLLALEQGEVVPAGRARTRRQGIEELLTRIERLMPIQEAMVVHATTPEDLDYLVRRLHNLAPGVPVIAGRINPVVGVHAGPGILGIGVVAAEGPRH